MSTNIRHGSCLNWHPLKSSGDPLKVARAPVLKVWSRAPAGCLGVPHLLACGGCGWLVGAIIVCLVYNKVVPIFIDHEVFIYYTVAVLVCSLCQSPRCYTSTHDSNRDDELHLKGSQEGPHSCSSNRAPTLCKSRVVLTRF